MIYIDLYVKRIIVQLTVINQMFQSSISYIGTIPALVTTIHFTMGVKELFVIFPKLLLLTNIGIQFDTQERKPTYTYR